MRMRFSAEDDEFGEFREAAAELVDRFAAWVRRHDVPADPSDVQILLEWRYSYADGVLDVWTRADVEEFLLEWCPRKVSAEPDDVAGLPGSIAGWVDFLAHDGLLATGSDSPSVIREFCGGITTRFRAEMADPGNFGMAKSLLGGGEWTASPVRLPASVGPVRIPRPEEIAEVVRDGNALPAARALAQFCAAPGRKLTAKGNLRLADARELVALLGTGDDPDLGEVRTLQSAEQLPGVSTWVAIGLAAGVVRRHNGRLVAVARFAQHDDVAAHAALVRAGLAGGLRTDDGEAFATDAGEVADHLLAMLLEGPADGADALGLIEEVLAARHPRGVLQWLVPATTSRILEVLGGVDLIDIEMVECTDCPEDHPVIELTPAGVPHAVERVRTAGVDVSVLPDPAEACAVELLSGIMTAGPAFTTDLQVWLAAQPDAAVAVDELGAAVVVPEREPAEVLMALMLMEELKLPGLPEAVHRHVSGVHQALLTPWLIGQGQIDDAEVDPAIMARSVIDVAAVMIDIGAPDVAVDAFPGPDALPMLREVWRLDHPRLPEVLEMVGKRHPVKAVAKEARRSLMKLRNRR